MLNKQKSPTLFIYIFVWFITAFVSNVSITIAAPLVFSSLSIPVSSVILAVLNLFIWTSLYLFFANKYNLHIKKVVPWVWITGIVGWVISVETLSGFFTIPGVALPPDILFSQTLSLFIGAGGFQYIFKYHYPKYYLTTEEWKLHPTFEKNLEANARDEYFEVELSIEQKLEQIKELHDKGLIDFEVYKNKQRELLDKL